MAKKARTPRFIAPSTFLPDGELYALKRLAGHLHDLAEGCLKNRRGYPSIEEVAAQIKAALEPNAEANRVEIQQAQTQLLEAKQTALLTGGNPEEAIVQFFRRDRVLPDDVTEDVVRQVLETLGGLQGHIRLIEQGDLLHGVPQFSQAISNLTGNVASNLAAIVINELIMPHVSAYERQALAEAANAMANASRVPALARRQVNRDGELIGSGFFQSFPIGYMEYAPNVTTEHYLQPSDFQSGGRLYSLSKMITNLNRRRMDVLIDHMREDLDVTAMLDRGSLAINRAYDALVELERGDEKLGFSKLMSALQGLAERSDEIVFLFNLESDAPLKRNKKRPLLTRDDCDDLVRNYGFSVTSFEQSPFGDHWNIRNNSFFELLYEKIGRLIPYKPMVLQTELFESNIEGQYLLVMQVAGETRYFEIGADYFRAYDGEDVRLTFDLSIGQEDDYFCLDNSGHYYRRFDNTQEMLDVARDIRNAHINNIVSDTMTVPRNLIVEDEARAERALRDHIAMCILDTYDNPLENVSAVASTQRDEAILDVIDASALYLTPDRRVELSALLDLTLRESPGVQLR